MTSCSASPTAPPSGNQATVGTSWSIAQVNLDGAVIGPASVTDDLPAIFDGTTGKLIKSKTYAAFKTLLALVKADVGLGNVDNTSDATKNAAVVTLTNKTLTAPAISAPTGLVKGDVGLGNVDNTSDATKNAASVTLTNKTINASNNTLSNLATSMFAANVVDTDGTLAANSDTRLASQKAVKTYVALVIDGYRYGCTIANNAGDATNDIDIAAGIWADDTGAVLLRLASGITKRLDAAWAVGSGNGGLDTGSIANTTYHLWLIMRSDTGVVDVLFSASRDRADNAGQLRLQGLSRAHRAGFGGDPALRSGPDEPGRVPLGDRHRRPHQHERRRRSAAHRVGSVRRPGRADFRDHHGCQHGVRRRDHLAQRRRGDAGVARAAGRGRRIECTVRVRRVRLQHQRADQVHLHDLLRHHHQQRADDDGLHPPPGKEAALTCIDRPPDDGRDREYAR